MVRAAEEKNVPLDPVADFRVTSGAGVEGRVLTKMVLAGTAAFLRGKGVELPNSQNITALVASSSAVTPIFVAVGGRAAGEFLLNDRIKATTPEAIRDLRAAGIRVVVLIGDRREARE